MLASNPSQHLQSEIPNLGNPLQRFSLQGSRSKVRFAGGPLKKAETLALDGETPFRIVKGAPAAIQALAPMTSRAAQELELLARSGSRILSVACRPPAEPKLIGLIVLSDPPRADSPRLLAELRGLGVRPAMCRPTGPIIPTTPHFHSMALPSGAAAEDAFDDYSPVARLR